MKTYVCLSDSKNNERSEKTMLSMCLYVPMWFKKKLSEAKKLCFLCASMCLCGSKKTERSEYTTLSMCPCIKN